MTAVRRSQRLRPLEWKSTKQNSSISKCSKSSRIRIDKSKQFQITQNGPEFIDPNELDSSFFSENSEDYYRPSNDEEEIMIHMNSSSNSKNSYSHSPQQYSNNSNFSFPEFDPITSNERSASKEIKRKCSFMGDSAHDIVEEYQSEIFNHLLQTENKLRPNPFYMNTVQVELSGDMRAILLDWLMEVCIEYRLSDQTLFLSINYTDRYLSSVRVSTRMLQLTGLCALLLAAKLNEIKPPLIEDCVFVCDKTYNRNQIIEMESRMLNVLKFDLNLPTPIDFLPFVEIILVSPNKVGENTIKTLRNIASMMLCVGVLDITIMQYSSSTIATAAFLLSAWTMNSSESLSVFDYHPSEHHRRRLNFFTQKLSINSLNNCLKLLHLQHLKIMCPIRPSSHGGAQLKALRTKYAMDQYEDVGSLYPPRKENLPTLRNEQLIECEPFAMQITPRSERRTKKIHLGRKLSDPRLQAYYGARLSRF